MAKLDVEQILTDYGISTAGPGDRHFRENWINIPCPFCSGNSGNHLGYIGSSFVCHRCGKKDRKRVLETLTGEAFSFLYKKYAVGQTSYSRPEEIVLPKVQELEYPLDIGPMSNRHKTYLFHRKLNPIKLERLWGLLGTGPIGDYCHRIVAPVRFNGKVVSYITRDITGHREHFDKYLPCKKEDEVIPHKHTLYGLDLVPSRQWIVVVEGIADVWRLGPGSVATYGTSWTKEQLVLLSKFLNVYIYYDPEPEAQAKAKELGSNLLLLGSNVFIITENTDPSDLSQGQADTLMHEIKSDLPPFPSLPHFPHSQAVMTQG